MGEGQGENDKIQFLLLSNGLLTQENSMLRQAQHERQIFSVSTPNPLALSNVDGLKTGSVQSGVVKKEFRVTKCLGVSVSGSREGKRRKKPKAKGKNGDEESLCSLLVLLPPCHTPFFLFLILHSSLLILVSSFFISPPFSLRPVAFSLFLHSSFI